MSIPDQGVIHKIQLNILVRANNNIPVPSFVSVALKVEVLQYFLIHMLDKQFIKHSVTQKLRPVSV